VPQPDGQLYADWAEKIVDEELHKAGWRLASLLTTIVEPSGELEMQARTVAQASLPRYDHVLIVMEENKDYDQIIGNPAAPYINSTLAKEGANFTQMYGEEHNSQGNYFWLFSGSNQTVGFNDVISAERFSTPNLGTSLIAKGLSFKGYSED